MASRDEEVEEDPLANLPAAQRATLAAIFGRDRADALRTAPFAVEEMGLSGQAALQGTVSCDAPNAEGTHICGGEFEFAAAPQAPMTMRCDFISQPRLDLLQTLRRSLEGEVVLLGPSTVAVTGLTQGLAFQLAIDVLQAEQLFTHKFAIFYAHGTVTLCTDTRPGMRNAFARATAALFESLRFAPSRDSAITYSAGYRMHTPNGVTGYRVVTLEKHARGTTETAVYFHRSTTRFLSFGDATRVIHRDPTGAFESSAWHQNGSHLHVEATSPTLAKATLAKGEKQRAWNLPLTATLNSELGMAPTFAALAAGKLTSASYTIIREDDIGPVAHVINVTRTSATTLQEVEGNARDSLTIDDKGRVVRETSGTEVTERIFAYEP